MRILVILMLVCSISFGQQAPSEGNEVSGGFTKENAFVGGSLTSNFNIFQFNTNQLLLGANPMFGYYLKNWLDVAGVLNLQYNNFEIDPVLLSNGRKRSSFVGGFGVSTRVYPVDFVFVQVQPELNMVFSTEKDILPGLTTGTATKTKNLVPSLLLGAGMKRGRQTGKTFYWASILFDVMANKYSPYRNISIIGSATGKVIPIFRAGINVMLTDLKRNNNNN